MILYDSNRQMIGIDEETLEFLGFTSLEDFLQYCDNDLANLFQNKHGFIYKFKNFPWIDFILTSPEHLKQAVIELPDKEITVELKITRFKRIDTKSDNFIVTFNPLSVNNKTSYEESPIFTEEFAESESTPQVDKLSSFVNEQSDTTKELFFESATDEQKSETKESISFFGVDEQSEAFAKETIEAEEQFPKDTKNEPITESLFASIENELYETSNSHENESSKEIEPIDLIEEAEPTTPQSIESEIHTLNGSEEAFELDLEKIADELGVDIDFLKELIEDFIKQAETLKPALYEKIEQEDAHEIHSLIHKIKGAVSNLRLKEASEILAHSSGVDDIERLKDIVDEFYHYFEKLKDQFTPTKAETKESQPLYTTDQLLEMSIDPSLGAKELGLDIETIRQFILEYAKQNIDQCDRLEQLLKQEEIESLKKIIHKLKGGATNLRIEPVIHILDTLTREIDNRNLNGSKKYIDTLRTKMQEIIQNENSLAPSPQKSTEVSSSIGIPVEIYETLVHEFFDELTKTMEDKEQFLQNINSYLSISRNLRLEDVSKELEEIKRDETIEENFASLKEMVYNFTKTTQKDSYGY